MFIGLGLPILQGYGLTETSPVVSTNRPDDNVPASIGKPIPGRAGQDRRQGCAAGQRPQFMLGYWDLPEATKAMFTADGWLNTGDTARFDEAGHLYITGRLKEIIVLSNGEKIPPVDMETAIMHDSLSSRSWSWARAALPVGVRRDQPRSMGEGGGEHGLDPATRGSHARRAAAATGARAGATADQVVSRLREDSPSRDLPASRGRSRTAC